MSLGLTSIKTIFVKTMKQLNLPPYPVRLKKDNGIAYIFDEIRKKWLQNTPEEWVRQHMIQLMINQLNYPASLIEVERGFKVNGLAKRADILANSKSGQPILIVECKAPHIKINQAVFDQIARYNLTLDVPYLVVTNGMEIYACEVSSTGNSNSPEVRFLEEIPKWE